MPPQSPAPTWTSTQAYVLAAFALALGITLGLLFAKSGTPAANTETTASTTTSAPSGPPPQSNSLGFTLPSMTGSTSAPQSAAAIEQAAGPLLDAIKQNPKNYDALVKLGNLYYDGQKYQEAIGYYDRALKIHPDDVGVRTDMGTAYWYSGNPDRAIAEFTQSLKYQPGHPQTLFNLGVVRIDGKNDAAGAIKAWEELLAKNPNYPEKDKVLQSIQRAKGGG